MLRIEIETASSK